MYNCITPMEIDQDEKEKIIDLINLIDGILENQTNIKEEVSERTYDFMKKYGHL
jgi:hypothetical protein